MGLDSASTTGFCLLDGERILARGTVDAREPKRIETLAAFVSARWRPDLVAIEDSYLGKNVNTVKVLSRIQGRFEQVFAVRGIRTELVMANTWQKGLLTGLIQHGSKSAACKKAARMWVKATYGLAVPEDIADAICMSAWVSRRDAFAAKVKAAS